MKSVILFHLMGGTLRFNELRRKLPSVTQRMLTKQLRELEESGLVSRTVFPVVPPCVDYALTPFGETLKPVIKRLAAWGEENVFCLPAGRQERRLRRSRLRDAANTKMPMNDRIAPT